MMWDEKRGGHIAAEEAVASSPEGKQEVKAGLENGLQWAKEFQEREESLYLLKTLLKNEVNNADEAFHLFICET